jgi:S-formylglutathione hydrolase FrmB
VASEREGRINTGGEDRRVIGKRVITRRTALIAGVSTVAAASVAAGTATSAIPANPAVQALAAAVSNETAPNKTEPNLTHVERVWSKARGREVDLVTLLPANAPTRGLPISLLLHGLHGSARKAAPTGLLDHLNREVSAGSVPPFGFVAVDGGDHYWHQDHGPDNPMSMLLDEIPGWLLARGLGGANGLPFACTGFSMGGFGALLYARRRLERRQPIQAVATMAPALITSWSEMSKRKTFSDATDWASMDPLKHLDALRRTAVGVWCGTEDPFIDGVRRFIKAAHPSIAYTAKGVHGDDFNHAIVPSLVSFLGKHVSASA